MDWPVTLVDGELRLRPLRRRDRGAWLRLRRANADWLRPWEATRPDGARAEPSFFGYVADLDRQARCEMTLPLAIEYHGVLVGQVIAGPIVGGALRGASVGYWVSQHVAGRGIVPRAVALVVDHCFGELGLHRVGLRRRYLHIDGAWRDHRSFALLAEEVPTGLLRHLSGSAGEVR